MDGMDHRASPTGRIVGEPLLGNAFYNAMLKIWLGNDVMAMR